MTAAAVGPVAGDRVECVDGPAAVVDWLITEVQSVSADHGDRGGQLLAATYHLREYVRRLVEVVPAPVLELPHPEAGQPFVSQHGPRPGFVVGTCGHAVAGSEWRAGFRTCERCPASPVERGDLVHEEPGR